MEKVGSARAPIAAAMVGMTIGSTIDSRQVPVYIARFGSSKDEIFVTAAELRRKLLNGDFEKIPTGALGLYTYYERLAQGLRQLMAGSRKFSLAHISRDDITALTREATEVSGIRHIMDVDLEEAERISWRLTQSPMPSATVPSSFPANSDSARQVAPDDPNNPVENRAGLSQIILGEYPEVRGMLAFQKAVTVTRREGIRETRGQLGPSLCAGPFRGGARFPDSCPSRRTRGCSTGSPVHRW